MFRSRTGSSCLPEQVHQCVLQRAAMPSDIDLAKRELVKLLKSLAAKYKVHLSHVASGGGRAGRDKT